MLLSKEMNSTAQYSFRTSDRSWHDACYRERVVDSAIVCISSFDDIIIVNYYSISFVVMPVISDDSVFSDSSDGSVSSGCSVFSVSSDDSVCSVFSVSSDYSVVSDASDRSVSSDCSIFSVSSDDSVFSDTSDSSDCSVFSVSSD